MYITKNQQHEETQHADKVNTMNVHNKNQQHEETQHADKVNTMNVHNKKSTT